METANKFTQVTIGPCTLYHGDSRDIVPTLTPVDAVVTDPPYGLRFMNRAWDYSVPDVDLWRTILGASKPGAHLLAFAGTRTQHRMAVNIEDAGYEIRDMIAWVYGSGFPKSLDVSKAIDKKLGAEREQVKPRSVIGHQRNIGNRRPYMDNPNHTTDSDTPATPSARQWSGWGTALKPALEPITVARKPLCGTVAENVLEHGTGGINVDGCRVDACGDKLRGGSVGSSSEGWDRPWKRDEALRVAHKAKLDANALKAESLGRFPANLIHDGSEEVVALFPETKSGGGDKHPRKPSTFCASTNWEAFKGTSNGGDSGSAARFFYTAKANGEDRGNHVKGALPLFGVEEEAWRNKHPTVKPTALMAYLCRLVTPPGGVVLDPFMGSGSTAIAAMREGFRFIGIERDEEHFKTACERVGNELNNK